MVLSDRPITIGMVAGEISGDMIGASLIDRIKHAYPNARFVGIAGKRMQAQGCQSLFPMDTIAVIGLFEILKDIPRILSLRRELYRYFEAHKPDIFVGIDSPGFNLGLECQLKRSGIVTVHYNSPKVWAWWTSRVKKIARGVDLMLTLFPFEANFYHQRGMQAEFVGHPLADEIPLHVDQMSAKNTLSLPTDKTIIALLAGSRRQEVAHMASTFLKTAHNCLQKRNDLHFVIPVVNEARREQFQRIANELPFHLPCTLVDGQSQTAIAASDVVLLASGTATLEAMLLKKPMVVAYKVSPLTYYLLKPFVKAKYIALPNLIADEPLVPEFIQKEMTPINLSEKLLELLESKQRDRLIQTFTEWHEKLRCQASEKAAQAILKRLPSRE